MNAATWHIKCTEISPSESFFFSAGIMNEALAYMQGKLYAASVLHYEFSGCAKEGKKTSKRRKMFL